jgi:hypothetical protein
MTFDTLDGELALIAHQSRRGLRRNLLNRERQSQFRHARSRGGFRRLIGHLAIRPEPEDTIVPALRGYPYGLLG